MLCTKFKIKGNVTGYSQICGIIKNNTQNPTLTGKAGIKLGWLQEQPYKLSLGEIFLYCKFMKRTFYTYGGTKWSYFRRQEILRH